MEEDHSKYKYEAISNKVMRKDKRLMDYGSNNNSIVDTNPHSIKGKITSKDFGSRIQSSKSPVNDSEIQELDKNIEKSLVSTKKTKSLSLNPKNGAKSLLDSNSIEMLNYIPTTESNVELYNKILSWCSERMDNDVPHDVIESLCDMIIEILKSENLSSIEKKSKVDDLFSVKTAEQDFQLVYALVQNISDYQIAGSEGAADDDGLGILVDSEDESDVDDDDDDDDDGNSEDDEEMSAVHENQAQRANLQKTLLSQEVENTEDIIKLVNSEENASLHLDFKAVDKFWIIKQLSKYQPAIASYKHVEVSKLIFDRLEAVVKGDIDIRTLEHDILNIPDFEMNDLYYLLINNYRKIYYAIKLADSSDESEKSQLWKEVERYNLTGSTKRKHTDDVDEIDSKRQKMDDDSNFSKQAIKYPRTIDLNNLVFTQGSKLMTVSRFELPKGSFKRVKGSWEEIHLPPPEMAAMGENELLVSISQLPEWARTVFPSSEMKTLNRIQSKVYPSAFNDDCNILMCAPTGAGKTNVAMLTVLRTLSNFRNANGTFQLNNFKIVYIAPLKALVQEQVREFDRRLSHLGITVNELTGDANLTKHQIESTQILVTTPEKWDVITRKNNDASYINLVRLVIIDEIHLLHDERGPVLEAIVSRAMKNIDDNKENHMRFVGLSATLPNYKDVAHFLRVEEDGLFYFDASYRPCPLAQQFIGITEKKAFKKYEAMNEVCYEKVIENITEGNQVIIFVHSRKETAKTARWLANKLVEEEKLASLMKFSKGVQEILKSESEKAKNKGLKSVLSMGFGIHHAGMNRDDRQTSEDLFAEGHIKVLVSTATLAWGVNLPAHTVIIKGTSVYSAEKGNWVDLSPQDILQMLGRAGRPRYDTHGDGIIITSHDQIKYYLAVLNQQLPIESQMYAKLVDSINAEVVAGNIRSLTDCINWMKYTYLYVRMLHAREVYYVGPQYDNDPTLYERRKDLGYSAFLVLAENGLIKYNYQKDIVVPTVLGKISSYYYISFKNMRNFEIQLKPNFTEIELFRLFATSEEFKYVPVRREERQELKKLVEAAPIPINEDADDPLAKINVLLQAYISGLRLDGFALMADMVFISQSAGRLFRALYDLSLQKKWAKLSRVLLNVCKMVEKKLWMTSTPLRQYPDVPSSIIQVAERSVTPWSYYLMLADPKLVISSLKAEKFGNLGWELIRKFPQLKIEYSLEPVTPSLLQIHLDVTPHWKWDTAIHGFTEVFTLLVEDCDGENILYSDQLAVKKDYINKPHYLSFTVPIFEVQQPNYFVSLISERWLYCESKIPVMLTNLVVPKKFPPPTPLIDAPVIPITELGIKEFASVFPFTHFNRFQSQAFDAIYNDDKSVLFSSSKGNGKTTMATLSLLGHWKNEGGRAVYITPCQKSIDSLLKKWKKTLSNLAGGKIINKLTNDINVDLNVLAKSHLVLCTPEQIENVTRRWQQRKSIQSIELVIADDSHIIGSGRSGAFYEITLNRLRYMAINLETSIRFIVLSSSIASYKDFADWIDIPKPNTFVFDTRERIHPVEVKFEHVDITHNASLLKCLINPSYKLIREIEENDSDETVAVFVSSKREMIDVSKNYIRKMKLDNSSWLQTDVDSLKPYLEKIQDNNIKLALKYGIGYLHDNMAAIDQNIILSLFDSGILRCLVATKNTCCWAPPANKVVVLGTKEYEGKEHRYIDYSINDLLEMIGSSRNSEDVISNAIVYTNSPKLDYYKRFISLPLPLESHLNNFIHDALIGDIKLIKNSQYAVDWLTYSLFYRRLQLNPSFYKLDDSSENGLSEFLSELIETSLNDLESAGLVELDINDDVDDDKMEENSDADDEKTEVVPLNGCMIANYYNVSFATMELIGSLNEKSRLKKILEIICLSQEFEVIPIREGESNTLFKLYNGVPLRWSLDENFELPSFKSFILLQCYFTRIHLSPDHLEDLNLILPKAINLLYACIDTLASQGSLNAMLAMDLCQMVVQGMWNNDNVLKQIPYFEDSAVKKCMQYEVSSLYDFMELEDEQRDDVLNGLTEEQVENVAAFVNKYPNLEITYTLEDPTNIIAGESQSIEIEITRDEEVDDLSVVSLLYPNKKLENWWIVIGNKDTNQLYSIKKLAIAKENQKIKMDFTIPEEGEHDVYIWCVCDSYIDADKQVVIQKLAVKS